MIDVALEYASELVGIKYEKWLLGNSTLDREAPFWAANKPAPDPDKVDSCNCAGLINLIKRKVGGKIPYTSDKYQYAGGTWAWHDYLKNKNCLEKFDANICYPKGTLIIRTYYDENDQGHLAIVLEPNDKDPLQTRIIHSYSNSFYETDNLFSEPGIVIETLENSVNWIDTSYYHFVVLPEDWLLSN